MQLRRQEFAANNIAIVGLVVVASAAAFLRLLFLGQDSFWWDELASVVYSGADWQAFWSWELQSESLNLVLYYLILRPWLYLGESEFAVRSLSVIFGVLTVIAVFVLGKRLFDLRTGLIAALILAVHAFHIQFSQEARGYSLLTLLVTLSSLFFLKSIERPSWGNWAGYALTSALAGYSHFFGLLVLLAHASSLLFLSPQGVPWTRWMIAWSSSGLLLFPLVHYGLLRSVAKDPTVSETSLGQFVMAFTGYGGYPLLAVYLVPVLIVAIFAVKNWSASWGTLESWRYGFLLTWLLLPILLALGVRSIEPVFVAKYLLGCLPALVLLAAAGISRRRFPLLSGAVLIAIVALSARATFAYYTEVEKEDWRGAANLVAYRWEPGDSFLIYKPEESYFRHYLEQLGTPDSEMRPAVGSEWKGFIRSGPDREEIARFLPDEPERIWLVLVHAGNRSATGEIQAALSSKYEAEETHEFYKVRVILYSDPKSGVFGGQWNKERRVSDDSSNPIIEGFEFVSDLRLNSAEDTHLETMAVNGLVGQGLRVNFGRGGWWSVSKSLEQDPDRYQGISLAVKGNSQVGLQLREGNNTDGTAGEYWSVALPVTEDWRRVSYHWSDFERDGYGPNGNGFLDVDSIDSVRVRQGTTRNGYLVIDEWRMIEGSSVPWVLILGSSAAGVLTLALAFGWWLRQRPIKQNQPAAASERPPSTSRAKL